MTITEYVLLCILFYLIGSIPTAYLVILRSTGKDITKEGSGNVGALNSYEVTKSKWTGISVLVLDFLKGFIPSFIFLKAGGFPFETLLIPFTLLIIGHNFSVWLKFKGGRGLATAAGLFVAVEPFVLLIWCLLFLLSFAVYRKVHFGNIVATLLLPLVYYLAKPLLEKYDAAVSNGFEVMFAMVSVISLVILLKHIGPFMEMVRKSGDKVTK
ncbi:MAG: glycerol-3-phosphate acyltransferase [Ignavibacteriae bacterium]|nr:glycerol-3-phosphate acyltransferase [Ignavibacteriota bacterium]